LTACCLYCVVSGGMILVDPVDRIRTHNAVVHTEMFHLFQTILQGLFMHLFSLQFLLLFGQCYYGVKKDL